MYRDDAIVVSDFGKNKSPLILLTLASTKFSCMLKLMMVTIRGICLAISIVFVSLVILETKHEQIKIIKQSCSLFSFCKLEHTTQFPAQLLLSLFVFDNLIKNCNTF